MATSDTCNPVRSDITVAYGENHDFALGFVTTRQFTNAKCTLTIKTNNSSGDVILTDQKAVVNKNVSFQLTPAQCRTIGPGRYWYDIWLWDGLDFEKPIVMGQLDIPYLSTRSQ